MYLPTFNKLKMERGALVLKRYGTCAIPLALWGNLLKQNLIKLVFKTKI